MALSNGRTGRLTARIGGFRPAAQTADGIVDAINSDGGGSHGRLSHADAA
jgi:hypothetical protein